MASKKVTVWFDETSDEQGYVVDVQDTDGGTLTVNVLDDRDEAVSFGKRYADKSNLEFEDLTGDL